VVLRAAEKQRKESGCCCCPAGPTQEELLMQIRDLLKSNFRYIIYSTKPPQLRGGFLSSFGSSQQIFNQKFVL
jgi:hypothetical protein